MRLRYYIVQPAIVCLILYFPFAGNTQTSFKKKVDAAPVKTYTVGDKVPDLVFKNLVNYRSSEARLSDFKGKLLIIDFWEWGCTSCMAAMPKLQQLKKEFSDKLQVITVTTLVSAETLQQKINNFHSMRGFSLPTVVKDEVLHKYFPYDFISHLVWIDGNGFVKAITGSDYVTADNIRTALQSDPVLWPVKKDVFGFDYEKPLLSFDHGDVPAPALLYSSSFTGYIEGLRGGTTELVDSVRKTKTINHINVLLLTLCDGALNGEGVGFINPKYLVLNVNDSSKFLHNPKKQYYGQWLNKSAYCYSVTFPHSLNADEQKEFISNDLSRWLSLMGITVKKEIQEVDCYALVRTKENWNEIHSKGGETSSRFNFPDDSTFIRNDSLSSLLYYLNNNNSTIPLIVTDSSGLPSGFAVDMNFSKDAFKDASHLRKELQQYGFDLVRSGCLVEVHVITEKPTGRIIKP